MPRKAKTEAAADSLEESAVPENWNYESTVEGIEEIIEKIESGELELEQVFEQFASAMNQLNQCDRFLNHQQQQVDLLIETLADNP
jgi:exodeoxyribonuclease VII small subunit